MGERTTEERWEHFAEIIRKGGSIWCHPNTLKELRSQVTVENAPTLWPLAFGTAVVTNELIEPGTFVAVAKPKPFEWAPPSIEEAPDAR